MATPPNPPDPFVYQAVPVTAEQSVDEAVASYSTRIAKSAMQGYFSRFFGDGDLAHVLASLAPKTAVSFDTDSIRAESQDKRFLQLARKITQLYQKLPCILIADTGSQRVAAGLGYYEKREIRTRPEDGKKTIVYTRVRTYTVSMEFAVGAMNEDGAAELQEAVSLMLENRHRVGSLLQGDNWEVRLPMQHQVAGVTPQNINDDPTQTFGMASVTADIVVEVWYFEEVPATDTVDLRMPFVNRRSVLYPTSIRIGDSQRLVIRGYPPTISVLTDNPNVALITGDRMIKTISAGDCRILIKDQAHNIDLEFPLSVTV